MAKFDQRAQNVHGNVYNADSILNIGSQPTVSRREALERLVTDLQDGAYGSDVGTVTRYVQRAQVAEEAADTAEAQTWLQRAAVAATPVAALATAVAQIMQSF